jgi:hypothetical protein
VNQCVSKNSILKKKKTEGAGLPLTSMHPCHCASGQCSSGSGSWLASRGSRSAAPASLPLCASCVSFMELDGRLPRLCKSVGGGGRWGRVTGTGQVQSCLPVDDEELLLAGDAGAGVDEDPLVLLVVSVVGVCPVGRHVSDDRSRCSSWMAGSLEAWVGRLDSTYFTTTLVLPSFTAIEALRSL